MTDPIPAPERWQAECEPPNLVNKICIFHPVEVGEWPAKGAEYDEEGNLTKQSQKASQYVSCDVWVLDRARCHREGAPRVRVSWWEGRSAAHSSHRRLCGSEAHPGAGREGDLSRSA